MTPHYQQVDIVPHEQKLLNWCVHDYLVRQGYRISAITFSDECSEQVTTNFCQQLFLEQDLDDWEDGGLGRPPGLLSLYRGVGLPESEKKSLEAVSQTEEVLESPKALLEASQQVTELENRLRKQSEEHSELQGKFCGIEEELARITSRTEEAVQEVERERCEKEELVEKLRNMELEKKAAGALEEPPHRPEVEREDGDGASVADEPVLLQPCHGKQMECTGSPIIFAHYRLYTAQIYVIHP